MTLSRRSIFVVLALVFASSLALFAAEPLRTWTDATGKFSVQARIVGFDAGVVKLTKEDGSPVSLPLERLCAEDQTYVRAYDASNPFRPRAAATPPPNPFLPGTSSGATTGEAGTAPMGGAPATPTHDAAEDVPVDWSAVPAFDLSGPPGPLTVPIEANTLPEKVRTVPVKLAPKIDFWDRDPKFLIDRRSQMALLVSIVEGPRREIPVTAVIQIDLASGASKPPIPMTGIAVHAWDGVERRIVVSQMQKRYGRDDNLPMTVEVWKVGDKEFLPLFYAVPTERDSFSREETVWAEFLPENRFATLTGTGRLTVWSIDSKQPLATAMGGSAACAAVSDDGGVIAFAAKGELHFLDSRTLGRVGGIGSVTSLPRAIDFSPDGARIAVAGSPGGGVWNLSDGRKIAEFAPSGERGFFFADPKCVYADGTVYDAESGIRILQVRPAPSLAFGHADRMWMVAEGRIDGDEVRKLHVALPRPARTDERITEILSEPMGFLLPPGQAIRIDVDPLPPSTKGGISAKLREAVERSGHVVADDAQIMLEARLLVPVEPLSIPYTIFKEGEPPKPPQTMAEIVRASGGIRPFPSPITRPPGGTFPGTSPGVGSPGTPFGSAFQPPDPYADLPKAQAKPPIISLRLVLYGQELWADRRSPGLGYPMTIRLKENETVEQFLASLEVGDARHFAAFDVPKSIVKPGEWQHPAHGYYKLTLDGLQKD